MPRLDRIYTKTGDEGMTGLGGGQRVRQGSRAAGRTYGTVDELNSQIGVALAIGLCERLAAELPAIQNQLLRPRVGPVPRRRRARHATRSRPSSRATSRRSSASIDEFNAVVGPLTNFLLPGGSPGAAQLHVARTICRRAEREAHDARSRRGDRPTVAPLPQPPVRRAVRHGPLREPRARRRRTAVGARADVDAVQGQAVVRSVTRATDDKPDAEPARIASRSAAAGRERHHDDRGAAPGRPATRSTDARAGAKDLDAAPEIAGGG